MGLKSKARLAAKLIKSSENRKGWNKIRKLDAQYKQWVEAAIAFGGTALFHGWQTNNAINYLEARLNTMDILPPQFVKLAKIVDENKGKFQATK